MACPRFGTICLELVWKWETPGPYVWPVKRQQLASRRFPRFVRRPGVAKRPACPLRIVAVGLAISPFAAVVLVARPPVGEVTAHPPPGSPRSPGAAAIQLWGGKNFLSYTSRKMVQMETAITDFFSNIFSSVRCRLKQSGAPRSYPHPRPGQFPGRSCRG